MSPVRIPDGSKEELNRRLMMLYLGGTRSASEILRKQSSNISSGSAEENQMRMCDLARDLRVELEDGRLDSMGEILDKGWRLKRTLSSGITNPMIDEVYETVMSHGAVGGKLLGAGGNGFMLFYADESAQEEIRRNVPGRWMPFRFDDSGSTIIYNDEGF